MEYPGHQPHVLSASCRKLWLMALPVPFPVLSVQSVGSRLLVLFRLWLEKGIRFLVQPIPPQSTLPTPKLHISIKGPYWSSQEKTSLERAGLELALGVLMEKPGCAEAEWGKRMLSQKPDFSTHSISSPSAP